MNEMNCNIQDFCCFCLSTSNEKCSKDSSKYPDNLTPFDKIKTIFPEFSLVMNSENRICLKCSDIVHFIYKFNRTCLKNINNLNSSKNVLKENKSKKQCDHFVNLNESKQFEANIPILQEVKIEPPESPLNNYGDLCNTNFALESHSNGAIEVNEELKMNYETCHGESVQVKKEIKEIDLKKEWINEIDETWQDELFKQQIKDFENISVQLTEEVFVKEEENTEILEDPLLEVVCRKSTEKLGRCESIGEKNMLIHSKSQTYTGKKSHKCDICGKKFILNGHLKTHMLIHTGEKPHMCDVCGKFFTQKNDLKRHMLTHTGEKPHKCNICGKLFNRNGHLKTHMLIHTGEKPHKCEICGKCFTLKVHLKAHMLIHTGEKPHKCDICGKLFNHIGHLKSHMLIHTGEKPYKCNVCGKSFNLNNNLKTHMLIHNDEKPYKCDTCSKSFLRKDKLKSHMSVHISEN